MRMNLCQNLLGKFMYKDLVTVRRSTKLKNEDGGYEYKLQNVYENIPCKLSQYSTSTQSTPTDRALELSDDYRITLDPEYDLNPNDIAIVLHNGQKFSFDVIQPFKYPTHQEITVRRKREA